MFREKGTQKNISDTSNRNQEPEIKLPTSVGSSKKRESARNTYTSALLTMLEPFIMCITTKCGKFLKRWEYETTSPASEKFACRSRSNS